MKRGKFSVFFLLLAATCFLATAAFATAKRSEADKVIQIKKFTGTIRITTPSKQVIVLSPGDPRPAIPLGSVIYVVSGTAEITAGGARVFLEDSQGIEISGNAGTGKVSLAASPETIGTIKTEVGNSKVTLNQGGTIEVAANKQGKPHIVSTQGDVQVVSSGKDSKGSGSTDTTKTKQEDNKPKDDNKSDVKTDVNADVLPEPPQTTVEEASPSIP